MVFRFLVLMPLMLLSHLAQADIPVNTIHASQPDPISVTDLRFIILAVGIGLLLVL